MKPDSLKQSALLTTVSELVADLADLFQKEIRLAKAEFSASLSHTVQAGVWMAVATALGLAVMFLVVQAGVYGLIAAGLPGYAACLVLAALLAGVAAAALYKGRSDAARTLSAQRTIRQIKENAKVAKEQLG